LVLSLLSPPLSPAEEARWGADVDFNSRYIWNGIAFSEKAVAQPSVWAASRDVTLELWGSAKLAPEEGRGQLNEANVILTYARGWDRFSLEPSLEYYIYLRQPDNPNTAQAFLTLHYNLGPADLFWRSSVDIAEYSGAYLGQAGIEYHFPMPTGEASLTLYAGSGSSKFNETYFGVARGALNMAGAGLTSIWRNGAFFVQPHAEHMTLLDRRLKDVSDPRLTSAGVMIGVER
jgi:hypothetical protein